MHIDKKIIRFSLFTILLLVTIILGVKAYPFLKTIVLTIGKLLLPFIVAAFISYLIYPIVLKLQQYRIHKVLAICIIYVAFFSISFVIIYKSIPVIIKQLEDLSEQLPQLMMLYEEIISSVYESTAFLPENIHDKLILMIEKREQSIEIKINNILEKITNLFDFIVLLTLIPILVFYFMKDYPTIRQFMLNIIPTKYKETFEQVIVSIDESLGSYIRGQVLVSMSVIMVTLIVYEILQLKYALLLAILMGIMNIIPYFGPIIGTVPAIFIAMTHSWKTVLFVIIATLVIQLLESSFLSPYIMGKSVRIHPLIIILLLLIGAQVAGIIGMIIAVPVATIIRGIVRQFYPKSEQSD